MDIQAANTPAKAKAAASDKQDKSKVEDGREGAPAFAQLLQGLQPPAALEARAAAQDALEARQLPDVELLSAENPVLRDGMSAGLDLSSLVGQADLLDERADTVLQSGDLALTQSVAGSFVLAQQAAGRTSAAGWGAQPHVPAGQAVATVAAGVQSALPWVADGGAAAAVVKVATEAAGLVEDGLQAVADLVQPDTPTSEGRVSLLGAWKLEDPQAIPSPTLQRVIGQVEQWAAAGAGLQPKATERAEGSKAGQDAVAGMSAAQGSGTRLTENAVRETQQAQDAQWEAQADVPVEDMRFWLQGKQQRAEVVLDQDGQNVRVQVSVRGNEAHVTFQADQQHTRAVLDNSLAQLREMLEQQGVALAGVSVQAQTADGQQAGAGEQERGRAWALQGAARHAQVAVPEAGVSGAQRPRSQGLDVYA